MTNEVEIRWPEEKCDLCQRIKPKDERSWGSWDGWLSFTFCPECEKHREDECVNVMSNAESERIRQAREYWDTHPEELAEQRKRTDEYRKTLTKEEWAIGSPEIRDEHFKKFPEEYERVYGKQSFLSRLYSRLYSYIHNAIHG
jgi:hypothetical protein